MLAASEKMRQAIEILVIVAKPLSEECATCKRVAREVAQKYRPRVALQVVSDSAPAVEHYRGLATPAVIVAGRVFTEAHAPRREQLERAIRELLEEEGLAPKSVEIDPLLELESFMVAEVIDEVVGLIKPGKEASVYLARKQGDPPRLYAAKVYKDTLHRSFRQDQVYRDGLFIPDARIRRAVTKGTKRGLPVRFGMWVGREAEVLGRLYQAGADIPQPVSQSGAAILMEYVGDESTAAPTLQHVALSPAEGEFLFRRLLRNVEIFLSCDLVHADLSAFNVLYWQGQIKIIDFPQAVDARFNPSARTLLARDIHNLCRYFARYGVEADASRLAQDLWRRFLRSEL